MQFSTVAVAAFLAVSASAYEVLTPTLNSTVAKGETVSIEWTSVDTDAEVFSVYLTNFQTAHWPPTVLSLAQNVPRDDKSIELRIPCDISSDYGWQINFINGTNTYVIYAQSAVFSLDGDCVEPAPTSSYAAPYPTATGYTNTTTVHGTVTVTDHATATATLCKTVETVIYATPIVWFVEPSHEAVCDIPANPTATVTVTVTAGHGGYPTGGNGGNGEAPTGGAGGYPTGGAGGEAPTGGAGGYPTGGAGGEAPTGGAGGYPTGGPGGVAPPTGTGSYVKPTGLPEYTGAASAIKVNGAVALIVGAIALL